jgi:hypothetical protein
VGLVAVIIPTTQGLARVQQVKIDQQLRHAVMTINFRTERASVTLNYAEFVSSESGIISRLTQEHRYRVKISRDIITGSSWKLGMLAAHVMSQAKLLAEADAPFGEDLTPGDLVGGAKRVIWATGDVSDEYGVIPVARIKLKLEQSQSVFEWCQSQSIPIDLYVPEILDIDPKEHEIVERELSELSTRFAVLTVYKLERAPRTSSRWLSANTSADTIEPPNPWRRMKTRPMAIGVAALAFTAFVISVASNVGRDKILQSFTKPISEKPTSFDRELVTTIHYDPAGKCFQNIENRQQRTLTFRASGMQTITLPVTATTCGIDVSYGDLALEKIIVRVEKRTGQMSDAPDIQANQVRKLTEQVYDTQPQQITYAFVRDDSSGNSPMQVVFDYTGQHHTPPELNVDQ